MKKIYFIKNFDCKEPLNVNSIFKYREIYYSEEELIEDMKNQLYDFYEESVPRKQISYDEFYNNYNLIIEVAVVSLNHKYITTFKEYNNYLNEVKSINSNELLDYLISFTDECILEYDHNLNLKYTVCHLTNFRNKTESSFQFSFSYKALFPEKYHVEKYKDGDRVKYYNTEYNICTNNKEKSIYDSENPLDYLWGYSLFDDNGFFLQDDKWGYFAVDEDLEPIPLSIKETTEDQIYSICDYIFEQFEPTTETISNINENFKYNRLIRSDKQLSVILNTTNGEIEITKENSFDLMSYMFFNNEDIISYIIGFIEIPSNCIINDIYIKYEGKIIDTISINKEYTKGDCINISKII